MPNPEPPVSPLLQRLLAATALTRRGQLVEATETIRQALSAAVGAGDGTSAARIPATALTTDAADAHLAPDPADPRTDTPAGRFGASSFTAAAGTRAFKLYEPPGTAGGPRPLLVMLHGCTQDPDDFATGTRMNRLAAEQGVYVLYPAQAPRSNAHKCWNWFVPGDQRRGAGEPALLAGMTRHVMATHAIDPARVWVAGLSAGGAMAAILAREYPDLFAAVGIHSGLPPGAAHDVASAFAAMKTGARAEAAGAAIVVPAIVFHGDADATVSVVNGERLVASLAGAEALETTRERGPGADGRGWTRTAYRTPGDDGGPARIEHWVVHGAGHAWMGGDAAGSFTDPAGPDASREMLRFFAAHPRPAG